VILRQLESEDRGGSARGALNSTTSVEVVATPDAGFTRRSKLWVQNKDTAAVILRLRVTVAGPTHYEWYSESLALDNPGTAAGGHVAVDCPDLQNGETISAVLDAAIATNQPAWVSSWVDVPVAS